MIQQNIFAHTEATGEGYPSYVSINLLESGDVSIVIRGEPIHVEATDELSAHVKEGPTVSKVISAADWEHVKGF